MSCSVKSLWRYDDEHSSNRVSMVCVYVCVRLLSLTEAIRTCFGSLKGQRTEWSSGVGIEPRTCQEERIKRCDFRKRNERCDFSRCA